jgi:hypothetical protein
MPQRGPFRRAGWTLALRRLWPRSARSPKAPCGIRISGSCRMKTVSISSRLSYDDRQRIQVQWRALTTYRKGGVPLWLYDQRKLKTVLCQMVWQFVIADQYQGLCPALLQTSWIELQRAADVKWARLSATEGRSKEVRALRRAVKQSGGIVPLFVKVLWLYRTGANSCAIAAATGLTPWAVRQRLWRIRRIARRLNLETSTSV